MKRATPAPAVTRAGSDSSRRRIEWSGAEASAHRGWLEVGSAGDSASRVTIHISRQSSEDAEQIEEGLDETLANIRPELGAGPA